MKSRTLQMLLIALALLGGVQLGTGIQQTAEGQTQTARCSTTVPQSWGTFRGASSQGFTFEDQDGTIRVIRQIACPGLGTPQVAIEIRRQ